MRASLIAPATLNVPPLPKKLLWEVTNHSSSERQKAVLLNVFSLVPDLTMGSEIVIKSLSNQCSYANFLKRIPSRELFATSINLSQTTSGPAPLLIEYVSNGVDPFYKNNRVWGLYNDYLTEFIAWTMDLSPGQSIIIEINLIPSN